MRRWGFVITAFYAAVVVLLLLPGFVLLAFRDTLTMGNVLQTYLEILRISKWPWYVGLHVGILVGGQALLLFLSVDTSWHHAKPRQHLAVTIALSSFFAAILTFAAIWSLALGIFGEDKVFHFPLSPITENWPTMFLDVIAWWTGLWMIWAVIFYMYQRGSVESVSWAVAWLLKGSALELLIAVPAHIIVRHRNECSAPTVTGWGIVTGIAIMLMCFGPGVLALYKKKIDAYSRKREQRIES